MHAFQREGFPFVTNADFGLNAAELVLKWMARCPGPYVYKVYYSRALCTQEERHSFVLLASHV